ncbi:pilus assembly protein N-terminal domain-containing protein, partial [bacterium]|nr:pilus assembly protein N-terminal domain-containing protein [bacterium]
MKKKFLFIFILVICLISWMYFNLFALEIDNLTLNIGDSKIFAFDLVSKVNITNKDVVKVIPVSANELILNGITQGKTMIYIWDRGGRHQIQLFVKRNLAGLKKQIDQLLGKNNITINFENKTIFAKGTLKTKEEIVNVGKLIRPYSAKFVNLISVKTDTEEGIDETGRNWKKEIDDLIDNKDIKVEINQTSVILKGKGKSEAEIKQIATSVKKLIGKEKEVIDLLSVETIKFSRAKHIKDAINLPGVDVKVIYNGIIIDSTVKNESHSGFDTNLAEGATYNLLLCGKVANEREKSDADA